MNIHVILYYQYHDFTKIVPMNKVEGLKCD